MDADTTQTLEATQPNEQRPVLVIRFAGCEKALWCELRDLGPNSQMWETLEIALEDLPKGYLKLDENGEAPILSITAKMINVQEFDSLEEWYC